MTQLRPEAIQFISAQNVGLNRLCYERGLLAKPGLKGRVSVSFTISPDGSPSSVKEAGGSMPDPKVKACVVNHFRDLVFRATGSSIEVTYPISFTPGTP